jgi:hypothetical protein
MILATFNVYYIPIEIAFDPEILKHWSFLILNMFIDLAFMIDILVIFRTTYIDKMDGEEVWNWKKIAWSYVTGRFWIDLLASLPIDNVFNVLERLRLATGSNPIL